MSHTVLWIETHAPYRIRAWLLERAILHALMTGEALEPSTAERLLIGNLDAAIEYAWIVFFQGNERAAWESIARHSGVPPWAKLFAIQAYDAGTIRLVHSTNLEALHTIRVAHAANQADLQLVDGETRVVPCSKDPAGGWTINYTTENR
jgi:hypothetical protein